MKSDNRIIANIAPPITSISTPDIPVGPGVGPGPGAGAEEVALQLAALLTVGSALEVAVTVMVVDAPAVAQLGTITVSVAPPEVPVSRVSEVGEIVGDHPVPPEILRSKVSVSSPVFITVTV